MQVKRGFISIADGQVHYRNAGKRGRHLPFVMLHPGPTSAHSIAPLIERLGEARWVVAPDLMGMGDSDPPAEPEPDMTYFARSVLRFMDAMAIERCDLWGSVTGARCAVEISLIAPARVNRLFIELLQVSSDERTRRALQLHHAPKISPDHIGSQFRLLWHLARDQMLFYPWFERGAVNRRPGGLPSAEQLHEKTIELLKACRTYHLALNAALHYPNEEKLRQVTVPVIGPEAVRRILPGALPRRHTCSGPATAAAEEVDAAATEILDYLGR
jgi:pimeloyl-ACP methyl ester carboxylesterase